MAYSELDILTRDIDFFAIDREKLIHIASGGGQIPLRLVENDIENERIFRGLRNIESNYEIEVNPILNEIIGDSNLSIQNYLADFIFLAKKGFYTYDKTKIGVFSDKKFHLVAKPVNYIPVDYIINVNIESKYILPSDWHPFDLFDFF